MGLFESAVRVETGKQATKQTKNQKSASCDAQ